MTTDSSTTFTFNSTPLSKRQILERLLSQGHISFDEMYTLIEETPSVKLIPMPPYIPDTPQFPIYPTYPAPPFYTTCSELTSGKPNSFPTAKSPDLND